MAWTTDRIKNVSLAGHGGTGKTTLFERLLFAGGAIAKPETVESGKTVSDYTPEEAAHHISIHAALAHIERSPTVGAEKVKVNLFDSPGSSDFTGDVILTFRAAEFAALAVDGRAGVQIETVKLWRNLETREKPRAIVVTKLDEERSDFAAILADVKEKFGADCVPITIPMGAGLAFKGVIDVLREKAYFCDAAGGLEKALEIPAEYKQAAVDARLRLMEAAADGDEVLMEKYILMGALEPEEMHTGLIEALAARKYIPAFATAALKNSGLCAFLDFCADIAPGPDTARENAKTKDGEPGSEKIIKVDAAAPLCGLVIKTTFDQFSGKLSWVKIIGGKLTGECEILNVNENKKERLGKIYTCTGKKLEETAELCAGDIGIITKSASLKTSDTIAAAESGYTFLPLRLPCPVHSVAVSAGSKKDEDKLGALLVRATEEDKTFNYHFNAETKETVISGMGELQINIILDKIKQGQKIEVETRIPRVAYRETITKKASAEYTHKKQTGGHGQYGKVLIEIAPRARGSGYEFVNAIFGGAIPKNYIPGVEKGLAEGMARGTMAQYPVVDVEVKLIDGKYHPVDSSDLSFQLAGRNAFREAMKQAAPTLLEPVMNLSVWVEDKYLGDVMSDLSGKRGKILAQDSSGGIAEIKAQVPQAELLRYSIDLRSITSGTGSFGVSFAHYAPISGRLAEDVIKAAQAAVAAGNYAVQEED